MEKSKGRWQNENSWNQKRRLKPLPLTHAENKGLRCFFSNDHGCTAPKLNTQCCSAKDAVTVQWSPRQRAEHIASSTAVPAGAFQYLQREREGRQESPLGHCPVKRPNRRTYQIPDMEMHTPHRSTESTNEHRETCAPLPFPHGISLMQQEHKNGQKRDTARVRMLGKGYFILSHGKAWFSKQLLRCAVATRTKQAVLAVTMLCAPAECTWDLLIKFGCVFTEEKNQTNLHCY